MQCYGGRERQNQKSSIYGMRERRKERGKRERERERETERERERERECNQISHGEVGRLINGCGRSGHCNGVPWHPVPWGRWSTAVQDKAKDRSD
jgi:hypothetical protein